MITLPTNTSEQHYDLLDDKYELIKKIGDGATSDVYLGRDKNDHQVTAIKILKTGTGEKFKNNYKHFLREMEMLKKVDQGNIINITDGKPNGILKGVNNCLDRVDYISLELAENGELFDYIYFPKKGFGEDYGRFLFRDMMNGLNACHKVGVVHRDLKTENIMMTSDWVLKIADFGYATLKIGKDNNNLLDSFLGTLSYAAPEILAKKNYFGVCADVFSSGVILYILVTGKLPFSKAVISDDDYREIAMKNFETFWEKKSNRIGKTSDEFKSLINLMLAHDPCERPTVSEILQHPWVLMNTPSKEQMNEEFKRRDPTVKNMKFYEQQKEQEQREQREQRERMKSQRKNQNPNKVYKGGDVEVGDNIIKYENELDHQEEDENYEEMLKKYVPSSNHCKFNVKNMEAIDLLEKLIAYFYDDEKDKRKKEIIVFERNLELKITYKHPKELLDSLPGVQLQELEMKVEIKMLQDDSKDLICEFFKNKGDRMEFYDAYENCAQSFDIK